jgi:hypothetical protein
MRTVLSLTLAFVLALAAAVPASAQPGGSAAGYSSVPVTLEELKAAFPKTNVTTDTTDVWWPDAEPGWGIFFIQNNDIIFAVIFIYNAGSAPTFYVAVLGNPGGSTWTGDLAITTGSPFNAPWNPAAAGEAVVGTMSFTLTGIGTGTLTYNVGASNVSKSISRQALKLEDNSGDYLITDSYAGGTGCSSGNESGTLNIVQAGTAATLTINWGGTVCTFPSTYSQLGRLGQYNGTMSCTSGATGTALFFEIQNRVKQVNGRYIIVNNTQGCTYNGRFAAIDPVP